MLRYQKIFLSAFSAGFAKILSIAFILITTPLLLSYLGPERFGLWMAISSTVAMLAFADMGIGSGLMNAVSAAYGQEDYEGIREVIGMGICLLGIIAISILIIFFTIYPFVEWAALFNVNLPLAISEVGPAITISVVFFALSIPASLIFKILMGLQMGGVANLWISVGSIFSLLGVLIVFNLKLGLPSLAVAFSAPPVIVGIFANIYIINKKKFLLPVFAGFKKRQIGKLSKVSGLFFVLQISGLIAFQSDNLVIAHYLGANEVGVYAVTLKLFSIPAILVSFYLNAIWPAYTEANSRGDKEWVLIAFYRALRFSAIIIIPMSSIILIFGKWLIEKWVGPSIEPSWSLLIGLYIWSILTIFGGNFAALLNGLNVLKFQMIVSISMAIVNLILSIFLVKLVGISGVVWGSVFSLVLINYIPTAIYLKYKFKGGL
jgi:O-antigen/teichoic acid export membrane protein